MKRLIVLSLDLRQRLDGKVSLITSTEQFTAVVSKQESGAVLEAVDQLLRQAKLEAAQVDTFKFYPGPGSFIGLRVAASIINAWASQYSVKVVDEQGNQLDLPVTPQYGGEYVISKVPSTD